MSFAILHGEQVLFGILFAGVIALVGVPVLLYIWLRYTKLSELKLALAYLTLTAILCTVFASTNVLTSNLSLVASSFAFIMTLPWNVLLGWAVSEIFNARVDDREFALVMLFGAGINTVLLYLAAGKMRRLIK